MLANNPAADNRKQPKPVDIAVGGRIKLRRTMLGMSQEKLAEGLGITFQQIQKYEKGMNRVGASRLDQIAKVLKVPPSYFFGENTQDEAFLSEVSLLKSSDSVEMARVFNRIPDLETRRHLIGIVRACASLWNEPAPAPAE